MKFSTKSTYGIRALIRLVNSDMQTPISAAQIAKDENLSADYLERILSKLVKHQIVRAEKGSTGGYLLTRAPGEINLLQIISALEGKTNSFNCPSKSLGQSSCKSGCSCSGELGLSFIQSKLDESLRQLNLSQLAQQK